MSGLLAFASLVASIEVGSLIQLGSFQLHLFAHLLISWELSTGGGRYRPTLTFG